MSVSSYPNYTESVYTDILCSYGYNNNYVSNLTLTLTATQRDGTQRNVRVRRLPFVDKRRGLADVRPADGRRARRRGRARRRRGVGAGARVCVLRTASPPGRPRIPTGAATAVSWALPKMLEEG